MVERVCAALGMSKNPKSAVTPPDAFLGSCDSLQIWSMSEYSTGHVSEDLMSANCNTGFKMAAICLQL
jgi:hypothetical protein